MRIRITRPGVFDQRGDPIQPGTEINVPDDFTGWANKWESVTPANATLEPATPHDDELDDLRAQYETAFGEAPHGRMKADTIRRKLGEADDDDAE